MNRQAQNDVEKLDDEVIKCFIDSNGRERTTQAERHEVAREWLGGNYEHHRHIALQHGLIPVALVIAALVDIEHPLLTSGRGVYLNSVEASAKIIQIMAGKQEE